MYNTRATDRLIILKMNTSFNIDSVFEEKNTILIQIEQLISPFSEMDGY